MPNKTVNGVEIHYQDRGNGPALVLIHGFPLDSRIWDAQIDGLSERYRVIAPDLRGFGQSPTSGTFTLETLADDIHGLGQELDISPFVLGGLSMGGYIALVSARKYPADLAGLILVDTKAAADSTDAKLSRGTLAETVIAKGAGWVADQMAPRMLAPGAAENRPEVYARMRQLMESCPPETIARAAIAMRDRADATDLLPSIACPALILCGQHDPTTGPQVARSMADAIPGSQLEIIDDAGHLSPLEQPEAVTDAMRRFMHGVHGQ